MCLREWYAYWANPDAEIKTFVLMTGRHKSIQPAEGDISIRVIDDTISFIREMLDDGHTLNKENCPEAAAAQLFNYALQGVSLQQAITSALNVQVFSGIEIMNKWDTLNQGQKQLVRLWYNLFPDESYLCHCILNAAGETDLRKHILLDVFSLMQTHPDWVQESREIVRGMSITKDTDFFQYLDGIPEFSDRLPFLTGKSKEERIYLLHMTGLWMRQSPEDVVENKTVQSIYPQLMAYLDEKAPGADLNIQNYLSRYKAYKLSNTLPEDEDLYGFIVLATELNYTKAAERLHITQQTLSKQISSMEADIGGRLFERTTKKVALTELGTKLFAWFSRTEREYKALIKEYVDQAHKHIDICCFEDMDIGTEIGEARKRLTEENPDLNIKYSFAYEHSFGTIVKGLDRGIFNLAIVPNGSVFSASKFRTVTLHENDFVVYFSPTLCDLPHPTLYDLRNYKFLIGADSDNAISMVQDICRASGFEPILDMSPERSPSVERMMIESGEGIGFGGERSILNRFQSLRSISTNTTAKIMAVWRKDDQNSVIPSFVSTLKKVLNNA